MDPAETQGSNTSNKFTDKASNGQSLVIPGSTFNQRFMLMVKGCELMSAIGTTLVSLDSWGGHG
jgi:hypothetical protein